MDKKAVYHTIGQVAEYTQLPQSVLRYWETVIDILNPEKSAGGNRRYSSNDVKIIESIKELLYDQGFTIKGANKKLLKKFPDTKPVTPKSETAISDNHPKIINSRQINRRHQSDREYIIKELKSIIRMIDSD